MVGAVVVVGTVADTDDVSGTRRSGEEDRENGD